MDINCDLGESFGRYELGEDEEVMQVITSANVACGLHAGDPLTMERTVRLAARYGVAVGAHPGYPDLQGFGRREMDLTPEEVAAFVLYQIGALAGFTRAAGVDLCHVKPHGALYNQAAQDPALAEAVALAVKSFSRDLILVGLAGSALVKAGEAAGLRTASEGFPDRAYNSDGSLRSRREPGALLTSTPEVCTHAVILAKQGIRIEPEDPSQGRAGAVRVTTLCIHGDHPGAARRAAAVRNALQENGIPVERL